MTFPLYLLLIPYLIFLAVWAILSLIAYYHLLRFGGKLFGIMFLGVIYFVGAVALLQASYQYISPIDWQSQVSVFSGFSSSLPSFEGPEF